MIRGAFKRTMTAELAAYAVCAVVAVLAALLLPAVTPVPEWAALALLVAVQVLLYRRFYGRF